MAWVVGTNTQTSTRFFDDVIADAEPIVIFTATRFSSVRVARGGGGPSLAEHEQVSDFAEGRRGLTRATGGAAIERVGVGAGSAAAGCALGRWIRGDRPGSSSHFAGTPVGLVTYEFIPAG